MANYRNKLRKMDNSPHPELKPTALVIGCVDARLNPKDDIGLDDGSAYIMRTIAAIVPPHKEGNPNDRDPEVRAAVRNSMNYSAALDKALKDGSIKHIINMPHTQCGGVGACHCGAHEGTTYIKDHLAPIAHLREKHKALTPEERYAFEEDVARENIKNLLTYPQVREAMRNGLKLHGWLLDTTTHQIKKVNTEVDEEFKPIKIDEPLTPMQPIPKDAIPKDIIEQVQQKQNDLRDPGPAPVHNPQVLIMSDLDASINPSTDFKVPYGHALIYRNELGLSEPLCTSQLAALEFGTTFAGKGPDNTDGIKKVILMGHYDSREKSPPIDECLERVKRAKNKIKSMRDSGIIKHRRPIAVESWVIDVATRKTYQFKEESHSFTQATIKMPLQSQAQGRDSTATLAI